MKDDKKIILKVLVGSKAHKLDTPESDNDYRAVYVTPTSEILSLNSKYKATHIIDGKDDNVSWELSHFLALSTKCNPTIMEVYKAPIIECDEHGEELRKLLPYVWNTEGIFNAWLGYGHNQRKRFIEDKDTRANKYATAWIRTLISLVQILETGDWNIALGDDPIWGNTLKNIKAGVYKKGDILDIAITLEKTATALYEKAVERNTDIEKVNNFLLKVRKEQW